MVVGGRLGWLVGEASPVPSNCRAIGIQLNRLAIALPNSPRTRSASDRSRRDRGRHDADLPFAANHEYRAVPQNETGFVDHYASESDSLASSRRSTTATAASPTPGNVSNRLPPLQPSMASRAAQRQSIHAWSQRAIGRRPWRGGRGTAPAEEASPTAARVDKNTIVSRSSAALANTLRRLKSERA